DARECGIVSALTTRTLPCKGNAGASPYLLLAAGGFPVIVGDYPAMTATRPGAGGMAAVLLVGVCKHPRPRRITALSTSGLPPPPKRIDDPRAITRGHLPPPRP